MPWQIENSENALRILNVLNNAGLDSNYLRARTREINILMDQLAEFPINEAEMAVEHQVYLAKLAEQAERYEGKVTIYYAT